MSWQARALAHALRAIEKPHLARADDPSKLRRGFERKARLLFHPPRGTRWAWTSLGEARGIVIDGPWVQPGRTILYFHGGGYIFGSPRTHMAMVAQLARRVSARAILPQYPLAPEHPFPAAFLAAGHVYQQTRAESETLILGGDSAGGGLALSVLAALIKDQAALPNGVFAFSPLTDLSFSGASLDENADTEQVLPASRVLDMAEAYLANTDPTGPKVSPLFAEFRGAPPVWLSVDDTEILRDDTLRLAERMQSNGAAPTLSVTSGLPHVWPMFHNVLPEARQTLDALAEWIKPLCSEPDES